MGTTFSMIIFQRNSTLWTPIDCAAAKGHAKVAGVLLEFDSPVDPMDKTKVTVYRIPSYFPRFQWTGVLKSYFPPKEMSSFFDENCRMMPVVLVIFRKVNTAVHAVYTFISSGINSF